MTGMMKMHHFNAFLYVALLLSMPWTVYVVIMQYQTDVLKHASHEPATWRRADMSHYRDIMVSDYTYDSTRGSNVAFFPLYPRLCALLYAVTGWEADTCLLTIANLCVVLATVMLYQVGTARGPTVRDWSVAGFCLLPTALFMHGGVTESLFTLLIVITLFGIQQGWPLWGLAIIAALASATRPVGIAVSVMVWWVAFQSIQPIATRTRVEKLVLWFGIAVLSSSGLLIYMAFLWYTFGDPLAFAKTQEYWTFLAPVNYDIWDKLWSLMTLEPIWNVYNPNSQRYWIKGDTHTNPLFSCIFWNPIFYLLAWFLIGLGWYKKWLKDYEIVLSVGLLLIPYVTRAYEMSMASHARFASVVIPQYFVLGRLFAMMPPAIAGCLCGLMGLMMGLWTALFVAGYRFF